MFLYLESLESRKVNVVLFDTKKIIRQKIFAAFSDKILETVDVLCGGRSQVMQLGAVVVHQGPGTFSAVRSGVLLANTLGALLDIPVIAVQDNFDTANLPKLIGRLLKQKSSVPIKPIYNREPNITVNKTANKK